MNDNYTDLLYLLDRVVGKVVAAELHQEFGKTDDARDKLTEAANMTAEVNRALRRLVCKLEGTSCQDLDDTQ